MLKLTDTKTALSPKNKTLWKDSKLSNAAAMAAAELAAKLYIKTAPERAY